MGMDAGGGKLPYSYPAHQDGKLVKSFSRVEPRKFGLGLVAGFLLVTCAYFSTAKFDAIHIAMISPVSGNAAGIGPLVGAAADTSDSKQRLDLGKQDPDALSMSEEGSRAEVLEKDDGKAASSVPESGRNAPLEDTRRDETFAGDSVGASSAAANPAAAGGKSEAVPARDDVDDAPATALLPPVTSEGAANSTQESGVLEDEELQVQDAVANPSKRSNDSAAAKRSSSGHSPSVVHSDPAILPAPAQQILAIAEVKQPDSETPAREWKPLCDITSNRRIDWCELDGDVRVLGANASVTRKGLL